MTKKGYFESLKIHRIIFEREKELNNKPQKLGQLPEFNQPLESC